MLTPKNPWKNKDEREARKPGASKSGPSQPGAVISGGKVTGQTQKPGSVPTASTPANSPLPPKAKSPKTKPSPATKTRTPGGGEEKGGAAKPFRIDRPLSPNFGTNDPKDMKKLRAATTAAGQTPPWVAGSALDKDDEQPETFTARRAATRPGRSAPSSPLAARPSARSTRPSTRLPTVRRALPA